MKKYFGILLFLVFAASCSTDDNLPALYIDDKQAEIAELEFVTDSEGSPFYYLIKVPEMIINWGDNTRPVEYVFIGSNEAWAAIKPLKYTYPKAGTYTINIRTYRPYLFDFSRNLNVSKDNDIKKLTLTNCQSLRELYCRNQPITSIDLTQCGNLTVADLGGSKVSSISMKTKNVLEAFYIDSTEIDAFNCNSITNVLELGVGRPDMNQSIEEISVLKRLRSLYVRGAITAVNLNMAVNDSLQLFSAVNANLTDVNLTGLKRLNTISIDRCKDLKTIELSSNNALTQVVLMNNPTLSASALNHLFTALPQVKGTNKFIILSGNAGDAACDRSIATEKGWIFKSSL